MISTLGCVFREKVNEPTTERESASGSLALLSTSDFLRRAANARLRLIAVLKDLEARDGAGELCWFGLLDIWPMRMRGREDERGATTARACGWDRGPLGAMTGISGRGPACTLSRVEPMARLQGRLVAGQVLQGH